MMFRNKNNKNDDALVSRIRKVRAEIRKEVEEELALKRQKAEAEGRVLWENNWVTPEESKKIQRKLKIKDKIVLVELTLLTMLIGFSSLSLYVILIRFLLPR